MHRLFYLYVVFGIALSANATNNTHNNTATLTAYQSVGIGLGVGGFCLLFGVSIYLVHHSHTSQPAGAEYIQLHLRL